MQFKNLREMYECGALNVKYNEGDDKAVLGGMTISKEQADEICKQIGWTDWLCSSFKIIDKTSKFIKGIKNSITNEEVANNIDITFHNRDSSRYYGKQFDRIFIDNKKKGVCYCVIYNMPGARAKYEVHDHNTHKMVALCSSLRQVGEFINDN